MPSEAPLPPPSGGAIPSATTRVHGERLSSLLVAAAVCGILGLALTVLPMVGITPLRLALSFGVGQPLCGVALALFVVAVVRDLRKRRVL